MGRDLDDICSDIKRRASLAMKAAREKMSDVELERYMQTLAEDVRVGLLIVSVEEWAVEDWYHEGDAAGNRSRRSQRTSASSDQTERPGRPLRPGTDYSEAAETSRTSTFQRGPSL